MTRAPSDALDLVRWHLAIAALHAGGWAAPERSRRWRRGVGATVIGTVSTPEKAAIATTAGADHIIYY